MSTTDLVPSIINTLNMPNLALIPGWLHYFIQLIRDPEIMALAIEALSSDSSVGAVVVGGIAKVRIANLYDEVR